MYAHHQTHSPSVVTMNDRCVSPSCSRKPPKSVYTAAVPGQTHSHSQGMWICGRSMPVGMQHKPLRERREHSRPPQETNKLYKRCQKGSIQAPSSSAVVVANTQHTEGCAGRTGRCAGRRRSCTAPGNPKKPGQATSSITQPQVVPTGNQSQHTHTRYNTAHTMHSQWSQIHAHTPICRCCC